MRKFRLSYLYVLALLVVAGACKKEEEVPRGEFASGVLVVNEGNFSDADGTLSFYNPTNEEVTQDIYKKATNETLAGVFQSVFTADGKTYIIDQVGSKITVVESETFKLLGTISEGLDVPRYMTVANGKGYVTNWGPFDANFQLPDSYVAVIDLNNFTVSKKLNTANGAEGIISLNNTVYVAASGDNTVHVIDTQKDEITGGFEVPSGPRQFTEDANGRLWVLCNNYITSNLAKIDVANSRVATQFEIAGSAKSITSNANGTKIYYLCTPWGSPGQVFVIANDASFAPQEALITGDNFYGLGVSDDETIYIGRSNGADNGTVIRYNSEGTALDNFAAGRFPNSFEFRK